MCIEYGVLQMALLHTYVAFSAKIDSFFTNFEFPGISREFPGNWCSREVFPGKLGFGNMLNPNDHSRIVQRVWDIAG